MDLLEYVLRHPAEFGFISAGIAVILYASLAKRITFDGDFPLSPEERKSYQATREVRGYGIFLGALPLLYASSRYCIREAPGAEADPNQSAFPHPEQNFAPTGFVLWHLLHATSVFG